MHDHVFQNGVAFFNNARVVEGDVPPTSKKDNPLIVDSEGLGFHKTGFLKAEVVFRAAAEDVDALEISESGGKRKSRSLVRVKLNDGRDDVVFEVRAGGETARSLFNQIDWVRALSEGSLGRETRLDDGSPLTAKLAELANLHREGMLSEEEFQQAKKRLLG